MRRSPILLALLALSLAGTAAPPALAASETPAVDPSAQARVDASRKALEASQAALQQAEDTGGDIRAARRSLANALKSLRAAELAAGVAPRDVLPSAGKPAKPVSEPASIAAAPAANEAVAPAPRQAIANPADSGAAPAASQAAAAPPPIVAPAPIVVAPTPSAPADGPKPYVAPKLAKQPAPEPQQQMAALPPADAPLLPKRPAVAATPKAVPAQRQSANPKIVRRGIYTEATTRHADGSKTIDISTHDGRLVRRIEVDRAGNEMVVIDQERAQWRQQPQWARPYADPYEVPPPPGYYRDGY